ncbi:hypothetical protein GIB67_036157 [Kingdonia uniflora]|uniref:Uncharacterized protein n=1 Tax=Kingdonia uniflora TaxID=39325 RepID=A0A7J7N975_9MAGN|nr:hypothetical protein GIB67_036157 [Kingdonia uniflora]
MICSCGSKTNLISPIVASADLACSLCVPLSLGMDFNSMNRKEIQTLCKKHKLPANQTTLQMVNALTSLLKAEENQLNDSKKMGLCLEERKEETEAMVLDPNEKKLKGRRKTSKAKVIMPDPIVDDEESGEVEVKVPGRTTRGHAGKSVEVELPVGGSPTDKKKTRRGVSTRKNVPSVVEMVISKSSDDVRVIPVQEITGSSRGKNMDDKADRVEFGEKVEVTSETTSVRINKLPSSHVKKTRKGVNTRKNLPSVVEIGTSKSSEDVHVIAVREITKSPADIVVSDGDEGGVDQKKGRRGVQDKNEIPNVEEIRASKNFLKPKEIPVHTTRSRAVKSMDAEVVIVCPAPIGNRARRAWKAKNKVLAVEELGKIESSQIHVRTTRSHSYLVDSIDGEVSSLVAKKKTTREEKARQAKMKKPDELRDVVIGGDIMVQEDKDVTQLEDLSSKPGRSASKRKTTAPTVTVIVPNDVRGSDKVRKRPRESISESGLIAKKDGKNVPLFKDEILKKARRKASKRISVGASEKELGIDDVSGPDKLRKRPRASIFETGVIAQKVSENDPELKEGPVRKARRKPSKRNSVDASKKKTGADDINEPDKLRKRPRESILESGVIAQKNSENVPHLKEEPVRKARHKASKCNSVDANKMKMGTDEPSESEKVSSLIVEEPLRRTGHKITTVEPTIETAVVDGAVKKAKTHKRLKEASQALAEPPRRSGRNASGREPMNSLEFNENEGVEEEAFTLESDVGVQFVDLNKEKPASKIAHRPKARKLQKAQGKKKPNVDVEFGSKNLEKVVNEKTSIENHASKFVDCVEVALPKVQESSGPVHLINVSGLVDEIQQTNVIYAEDHAPLTTIGIIKASKGTAPSDVEKERCKDSEKKSQVTAVHTPQEFQEASDTGFQKVGEVSNTMGQDNVREDGKVVEFKVNDHARNMECVQGTSVSNGDEYPARVSFKSWDGNGIPNSTKKYKEDQIVSYHATPFEERIEKALADKPS